MAKVIGGYERRTVRCLALFFAVLLGATGCDLLGGFINQDPPEIVVLADSYEPDNSAAEATSIAAFEVQEHTLHTPEDEDWFVFTTDSTASIFFDVLRGDRGANISGLMIEVYNDSLTLVATGQGSGQGSNFVDYAPVSAGVDLYVRIFVEDGRDSVGDYEIDIWG